MPSLSKVKCEKINIRYIYKNRSVKKKYIITLSSAEAPSVEEAKKNPQKMKNRGARGTTGRAKRWEPLPDNDFKMAPDFRESLGRGQVLHGNLQHGGGS